MDIDTFEKNFMKKWYTLLLNYVKQVSISNNISKVMIIGLVKKLKSRYKDMKCVNDLIENSRKLKYMRAHIIIPSLIIHYFEDFKNNIDDKDLKVALNIWLESIKNIYQICGCGYETPLFGIKNLLKYHSYNKCYKAIETHLRFYFYFFKIKDVDNSLFNIYKEIKSDLNSDEIDHLISKLPIKEKQLIMKSATELEKILNNQIKKLYFKINTDIYGFEWKLTDDNNNIIGNGHSSTIDWAEKDAIMYIQTRNEISTDCLINKVY